MLFCETGVMFMITVEDISREVLTVVSNFDFKDPIVKVGVFGSVARNEQQKKSGKTRKLLNISEKDYPHS